MAAKHTPGPWHVEPFRSDPENLSIVGPDGESVVDVLSGPRAANARLIAAAPDLLEALRPLAALAAYADEREYEDGGRIDAFCGGPLRLTWGDARRAATALARAEGR